MFMTSPSKFYLAIFLHAFYLQSVHNAHSDCVNYVRFLDTRVFATCSDDTQVALWDVRNLKTRMRTLEGHSNWVKNIEYSQEKGDREMRCEDHGGNQLEPFCRDRVEDMMIINQSATD